MFVSVLRRSLSLDIILLRLHVPEIRVKTVDDAWHSTKKINITVRAFLDTKECIAK